MKFAFTFFLLAASLSQAEMISIPENCFQQNVTPCLVRAVQSGELALPEKGLKFALRANSILKFNQLSGPVALETLQGNISIHSSQKSETRLLLNGIVFNSPDIFIKTKQLKIETFETKSFRLSTYNTGLTGEATMKLVRSNLATKNELVQFIAQFFSAKSRLVSFLESIEKNWAQELKAQTELQTKLLARSVASVEKSEKQKVVERQIEKENNKKSRDLLFYRTFYR